MSLISRKLWLVCLTALGCSGVLLSVHTMLALEPLPPSFLSFVRPAERDLSDIAEDGALRVALCVDEVGFSMHGDQPRGLAYDLALRIALRLGVKLETVTVENAAAGLREVLRGRADLFANIDSGPVPVVDEVAWTAPLESSPPAVLGIDADRIGAIDDLRGLTVVVPRHSVLETMALEWQKSLGGALTVNRLPAVLSVREMVAGAARGSFPLVVIDRDRARLEAATYEGVSVSAPLGPPLPVRWAARPNAPDLVRIASRMMTDMRIAGIVADLERTYLENPLRVRELRRSQPAPEPDVDPLTPWDGLFQEAATKHGLDWRLIAALSHIESRHDPDGVGPGGSAGLMQLMPATARAFGAEDPFDPRQNVAAGARHLKWLSDVLRDTVDDDRVQFVLAAYNMGLGHLEDARELAALRGLDPNRWADNVATVLPLLEDPEIAKTLEHGRARGSFTLNYVERVLARHRFYSGAEPQTRTARADGSEGS